MKQCILQCLLAENTASRSLWFVIQGRLCSRPDSAEHGWSHLAHSFYKHRNRYSIFRCKRKQKHKKWLNLWYYGTGRQKMEKMNTLFFSRLWSETVHLVTMYSRWIKESRLLRRRADSGCCLQENTENLEIWRNELIVLHQPLLNNFFCNGEVYFAAGGQRHQGTLFPWKC